MGIFDSVMKATSSAAKFLLTETEEEKQERIEREKVENDEKIKLEKLDTLRNPMRTYLKKGQIGENELAYLKSIAAKIGIETVDFERRFDMILAAKKEYDGNDKKGIFSKKSPDLFFYSEDEIEEYFEGKMSLTKMNEIGELKTERKIEEEMRRPHFDSAFADAFPVAILTDVQPGPQLSMAPPPMPVSVEYTLNVNGQNQGPYNMQQLLQLVQSGQLTRQTFVWKQGMANWETAGNVQELAILFGAMPPPPPTMPPTPPTV